jgi:hypothetical protein
MNDAVITILDDALAALDAGESVASILARYPTLAAELRPILEGAQAARELAVTTPPPTHAQAASRAKFLYQAGELRSKSAKPRPLFGLALLPRLAFILAIVLVALGVSGYGLVTASAQSLPGDALYNVKRTVEAIRLWLATDVQTHQQLETEFATRRTEEAHAITTQGRSAPVEFTGVVEQIQDDYWLVGGIAVSVTTQSGVSAPVWAV